MRPYLLIPVLAWTLFVFALAGCDSRGRSTPRGGAGTDAGGVADGAVCTPACSGRLCGDDGCGGSCGSCPAGSSCDAAGVCQAGCTPSCAGRVCGTDGCGGSCGTCPAGFSCDAAGVCQAGCTPSCGGRVCGTDGCGGTCGTCPVGSACEAGACVASCTPSCAGRECGTDGCGGTCGACGVGESCDASGRCGGATCTDPIDCGPVSSWVCDPRTLTCAATQCTSDTDCASTDICILQDESATRGACYRECSPASGGCTGGTCVAFDFTGDLGACFNVGTAFEGGACAGTATTTGCGTGLRCVEDGAGGAAVCRRTCVPFRASSCPSGQSCHPAGACVATIPVDSATVGFTCAASSSGSWCNDVAGAITGICDVSNICRRMCRIAVSTDCPSGQFCNDDFSLGDIGVCR